MALKAAVKERRAEIFIDAACEAELVRVLAYDLGTIVQRHGLKQSGVRNLAGLFLGFRIPKGTKTSNWARSTLTEQQIVYAATDAWACRELYLRFEKLGLNHAEGEPAAR